MNRDKVIKNQLRRLKKNHRKYWHHISHKENDYICPNKFFDNNCINIFKSEFLNKNNKSNIYIRTRKTLKESSGR